jgi:BirA family biotin operon repressor/biotin-[acetyl-CoA-carboxylase] ligase
MLDPQLKHFLQASRRTYRYLLSTTSTQDEIRTLEAEGAAEGSLVIAEAQTAGRGRRGRSWQSQPGAALTFSLLLKPRLAPVQLPLLSFAVAVALRQAVGVGGLKWPNDLLSPDRRKLAGILVEAALKPGGASVYVGVGINIKLPVGEGRAALEEFSQLSRVPVLEAFLHHLEPLYQTLHTHPAEVLQRWHSYSYTLGQPVAVTTSNGVIQGIATGIAEDGGLMIESEGEMHKVSAGEVALIGYIGEQP